MTELLTLQTHHLCEMGALGQVSLPLPLQPAPEKLWQKQFGRLTTDLCGGQEALMAARYALCPNKLCGNMILLRGMDKEGPCVDQVRLALGAKCQRRVLSEITEWPKYHARPEWSRVHGASVEPTCDEVLTKSTDSSEPALIFTYRSLKTSLALLLARPGFAAKCEQWRSLYDDNHELRQEYRETMSDVWFGQLWRDMQYSVSPHVNVDVPPADEGADAPAAAAAAPAAAAAVAAPAAAASSSTRTTRHSRVSAASAAASAAPSAAATAASSAGAAAAAAAAAASDHERYPLLAEPGTLALALNIDWYQPFKQGHHSQGLIWMTVQNLPRAERFLEENMILIGVLPGPEETSRTQLQGALAPLRDELLELFAGVALKPDGPSVRAFLFTVVCDIPAARMTCGFARETSAFGCPYCAGPAFPKRPKSAHNDWRLHDDLDLSRDANTDARHRAHALDWAKSARLASASVMATKGDMAIENTRDKHFVAHGARWSVLLDLPYYDSIRCMPTDVMHSVMLGMCKHVMGTFTDHRSNKAKAATARALAKAQAKQRAAGGAMPSVPLDLDPIDEEQSDEAPDLRDDDLAPMDTASSEEEEEAPARPPSSRKRRSSSSPQGSRKKGSGRRGASTDTDSSGEDSDSPHVSPAEDARSKPAASSRRSVSVALRPAAAAAASVAIAASAEASSAGSGVPVLSKSDLDFLQKFMNHCKCPRDVGRILRRLSTLSQIKAIEWLNWFSMFAVPTIRELIHQGSRAVRSGSKHKAPPKKSPALLARHLQIFILLHRIVTAVRAYTFTPLMIDALHADIIAVLQQMQQQFPADVGCVSPNMHLALHMRAQILDLGPPSGFWCMPYERMNGLLTRLPRSRSAPAISTANRALKGILLSAHDTTGRWVHRALDPHPGFTHGVRLSRDGNGDQHFYTFTPDAAGREARRQLQGWRDGSLAAEVRGDEPFPGQLSMLGGRRPQLVKLQSKGAGAARSESPAAAAAASAAVPSLADHDRRAETAVQRPLNQRRRHEPLVNMEHVLACLQSHYLIVYVAQLLDRLPTARARRQFESLDHSDQLLHAATLEWFATFERNVRVFDQLMLAGETFGSDAAPHGLNSYASVKFKEQDTDKIIEWYGRVSFYIEHTHLNGHVHRFAVMRWFDWVGQARASTRTDGRGAAALPLRPAMMKRFACCGIDPDCTSFETFPIVTTSYTNTHIFDLVPVQRLASRWIPSLTFNDCHRDGKPKHQHVCIVPSGAHE